MSDHHGLTSNQIQKIEFSAQHLQKSDKRNKKLYNVKIYPNFIKVRQFLIENYCLK